MAVAGLAALLTLGLAAGCDDSTGSDGNGDEGPPELRAAMEDAFESAPGFIDGFERLLAAVMGGPADGVAIVPAGNLVNLSVQVDTDGNDSRETTVTGSALFSSDEYDIDEGATVSFSGPGGTLAGATAFAQRTAPTTATFSDIGGNFGVPTDQIPPDQQVILTGGTLTLDLLSGNPSGTVEFEYLSDVDPIFGTIEFESDGSGGWRMRVTEMDGAFEFLVP
jgi:hypothetical protein